MNSHKREIQGVVVQKSGDKTYSPKIPQIREKTQKISYSR